MLDLENKTIEELEKIRNDLAQAWIIEKSEYQIKQLKKVNYEIARRNKDKNDRRRNDTE